MRLLKEYMKVNYGKNNNIDNDSFIESGLTDYMKSWLCANFLIDC